MLITEGIFELDILIHVSQISLTELVTKAMVEDNLTLQGFRGEIEITTIR